MDQRVIGPDSPQAHVTACAIVTGPDSAVTTEHRQCGAFKRDRRALAAWVASFAPEQVVMESTGIDWKSPWAALERVGIQALVVNARHVKQVPGRKTDIGDAQWLASLARAGLLRGSFVPPARLRELRLVARQRQKRVGMRASEKNRRHKTRTDAGIRPGVVVSDVHGKTARAMIEALIDGQTPLRCWRWPIVGSRPHGLSCSMPCRGCESGPWLDAHRDPRSHQSTRGAHRALRGRPARRSGRRIQYPGIA